MFLEVPADTQPIKSQFGRSGLLCSVLVKETLFSFSKLMAIALKDMQSFTLPYSDHVAIFSESWKEHIDHPQGVFSRLHDAELTMEAEK